MGCKGPETFANCPTVRFNDRTSWPVKVGHGCVGCTMPSFWDEMSPFYRRLPTPPPFATEVTADQVGIALVGAVAGLSVAHGVISYARHRREARAGGEPGAGGTTTSAVAVSVPPAAIEPAPPGATGDEKGTDR